MCNGYQRFAFFHSTVTTSITKKKHNKCKKEVMNILATIRGDID